jgi:hypothetical protein
LESNIFFVDIDEKKWLRTKSNISNCFFFIQNSMNYMTTLMVLFFDFTHKNWIKNNELSFDSLLNTPLVEFLDSLDCGNPHTYLFMEEETERKNEAQRVYYLNEYSQFPWFTRMGRLIM